MLGIARRKTGRAASDDQTDYIIGHKKRVWQGFKYGEIEHAFSALSELSTWNHSDRLVAQKSETR